MTPPPATINGRCAARIISTARAEGLARRRLAVDRPDTRLQELGAPLERLGLHILGERDRDRPGIRRVGEHAHGLERSRVQLLGSLDAIEEPRHRPKAVVDRHRRVVDDLELLEHRVRGAAGERTRRGGAARADG